MSKETIYTLFDGKTLKLIERALMGAGITAQEKSYLRRSRTELARYPGVVEKREWLDLALITNSALESIEGYYSFNLQTNRYTIHLPKNVPVLEAHIKRVMNKFPYPYDIEHRPALPDKVDYVVVPLTNLQKYQLQDIASSRGMNMEDYLHTLVANHINVEIGSDDVFIMETKE